MGNKIVSFTFKPEENEQIEAIVKMSKESRSVIHGVVKDCKDKFVKDAVVKLFELPNPTKPCKLIPITHTFTDECGQFIFGPLTPYKHYLIKIWVNDITIRHLNICTDEDVVNACKDELLNTNNNEDDLNAMISLDE